MAIIVDAHVHFYPCYDTRLALANLLKNLSHLDGNAYKAAFLAERHDRQFFNFFKENSQKLNEDGIKIEQTGETNSLKIAMDGSNPLYLFAGRQVVTAERIEILALTINIDMPDGRKADKVVEHILDKGGIPVISWAPGKWLFKRKRIVKQLIERFSPGEILIGDTTLRPLIWKEPYLMRLAKKRGFGLVAGSDPLPFAGEEKYMGSYGFFTEGNISADKPVSSVRSILRSSGSSFKRVGKRNQTIEAIKRLVGNIKAKRG